MVRKSRAFTLLELMAGILIAAIALGIAVPSFREFIQNNRISGFTSDFISAINLARSESVRRGTPVSVCASANSVGSACGNAANWTNGWIVFVDTDGDGALGPSTDRLKIHDPFPSNSVTVVAPSAVLTFSASGFLTQGSGTYQVSASGCTGSHARDLSISTIGRISSSSATCP